MRTIMQRCEQCGLWIDISRDERGQTVICTCGYVNTIAAEKQRNDIPADMFAPVPIAGKPAEITDDFIRSHFIICKVRN